MLIDFKIGDNIFKTGVSLPDDFGTMVINVYGELNERELIDDEINQIVKAVLGDNAKIAFLSSAEVVNGLTPFLHCFKVDTTKKGMESVLIKLGVTSEQIEKTQKEDKLGSRPYTLRDRTARV